MAILINKLAQKIAFCLLHLELYVVSAGQSRFKELNNKFRGSSFKFTKSNEQIYNYLTFRYLVVKVFTQ